MATKKKSKKTRKKYTYAVGRRRTATAQVRLFKGKGKSLVNDQPIEKYFPGRINKIAYERPLKATKTEEKRYVTVIVRGSGKNSQLEAIVHGLSRALDKENQEKFHLLLRNEGFLTRDSRRRERRKPGQMGRARKKKQSPKR